MRICVRGQSEGHKKCTFIYIYMLFWYGIRGCILQWLTNLSSKSGLWFHLQEIVRRRAEGIRRLQPHPFTAVVHLVSVATPTATRWVGVGSVTVRQTAEQTTHARDLLWLQYTSIMTHYYGGIIFAFSWRRAVNNLCKCTFGVALQVKEGMEMWP